MFIWRSRPLCRAVLTSLSVVLLAAGCGGGPKLPPRAPVEGTVTLDGKPLPRGTVQFVPDQDKRTKGPPAVAQIDADGNYRLSTAGVEGAVIGWHRVAVVAQENVDLNQTSYAPSLVPEKYNDPSSSGLSYEVKAGEHNLIDVELKSEP